MKKILVLLSIIPTLALANITGPKGYFGGSIGTGVSTNLTLTGGADWHATIPSTKIVTFDFGPRLNLGGEYLYIVDGTPVYNVGSLTLSGTFTFDANFKLPNTNDKFYLGAEVGPEIATVMAHSEIHTSTSTSTSTAIKTVITGVYNFHFGGKVLNDKLRIGISTGSGKGNIAFEVGYTF